MQFDFSIKYKQRIENVVVNALSRVDSVEITLVISQLQSNLLTRIQNLWFSYHTLQKLISEIVNDPSYHEYYTWINNKLRRTG